MSLLHKLNRIQRNGNTRINNSQVKNKTGHFRLYGRGPDELTKEEKEVFLPEIDAYVAEQMQEIEKSLLDELDSPDKTNRNSRYGSSVFCVRQTELSQDSKVNLEDTSTLREGVLMELTYDSGEKYHIDGEKILSRYGMHITSCP